MKQSPEQKLAAVRAAITAQRAKRKLFPISILADPAWDILLILYAATLLQNRCGIDGLAATGYSAKELIAWIDALVSEGLVSPISTESPASFRLTLSAISKMESFFTCPIDTSHC